MIVLRTWTRRLALIKRDTFALVVACRDPRTPTIARVLGIVILAYALSPIDLIPDFIPILGTLDDLIIVPLGLAILVRLIPPVVMAESRERAAEVEVRSSGLVAAVVFSFWVGAGCVIAYGVARVLGYL